MKGYLQVYTGDGKGKSTAAFGLALRARGAGLRVALVQFIKSMDYSEIEVLGQIGVDVDQFGRGCFVGKEPKREDKRKAKAALAHALQIFEQQSVDLLILDEINVAAGLRLITAEEVHALLDFRPSTMEVVCTGRYAPASLVERADLVTEMKAIRHYYDAGVSARDGIER